MKESEDAHGRMMYDFYRGKENVYEVIERDDGQVQVLPPTGYFRNYRYWSPRNRKAMSYVHGRVLDVGCGAGRHSLHLQRKGLRVDAIDISPYAIKTSRLRGVKNTLVMPLQEVGPSLGTFDTVLMLGVGFGLFGTPTNARRLLRMLYKMTTSNARIIAETRDPYKTKDPVHLSYHRLNKQQDRLAGQLRIRVRYQKYATQWFDFLHVSQIELKKILNGTGWMLRRIINHSSPIYIAIIEKDKTT